MKDFAYLIINYNISENRFKVDTSLNKRGQYEIVENFLRSQIGASIDKSVLVRREEYRIELKWFPQNDDFSSKDDTGNKGLRDGILIDFLKGLERF